MNIRSKIRTPLRTPVRTPDTDLSGQDQPSQRKQPETGQFRLQVDRQTKGSYLTLEAAEQAGLAIKQEFPLVQVTVHDSTAGTSKRIELPSS
jgi:hypothetical protein